MQARFIIMGFYEAMFGAPALTSRQHLTLPAPARQCFLLGDAEARLQRALHHARKFIGRDIAQSVLGIDAMITGKNITVMLYDHGTTTGLGMNADRRRIADPGIKRPLKVHDKDLANILSDPFLENGNEKIAVFFVKQPDSNSP